jgi:hypothetical protein
MDMKLLELKNGTIRSQSWHACYAFPLKKPNFTPD